MVMREMTFAPHKCPRCGKTFEAPGKPVPGMTMYCKQCTELLMKINQLERQLLAQEFSIEQEDKRIAEQINAILVKESSGISEKDEELLAALTERLISDEKRRQKILEEIRKLQKEKR